MTRRTPRVANWLLNRLGVEARNQALMGDLCEEFAAGRSRSWYWRQVTAAVILTVSEDLRTRKWLLARALVAAGAFFWLWGLSFTAFFHWLQFDSPWRGGGVSAPASLALCFLVCGLGGWLVVRAHRQQKAAVLFLSTVITLIWDWCFFATHADEIHRMPVPHQFETDLVLSVLAWVCFLVSGWFVSSGPDGFGEKSRSREGQVELEGQ